MCCLLLIQSEIYQNVLSAANSKKISQNVLSAANSKKISQNVLSAANSKKISQNVTSAEKTSQNVSYDEVLRLLNNRLFGKTVVVLKISDIN